MKKQLISTLTNIGITDHEAKVYLAALSLGPATVLQIARTSGIKRTTVYTVIDALKHKGFIYHETKGWKQYIRAVHPEKLEDIFDARRETFKKNLPELAALYNLPPHESAITYYEGLSAIKSMYTETLDELKPGDDYFIISDTAQWLSLDKAYGEKIAKRRADMKLNLRLLVKDTPEAKKYMKLDKKYGGPMKLLPKDVSFHSAVTITRHKMILQSLVPPISAIVVQNKSIIELQRQIFLLLWDSIR